MKFCTQCGNQLADTEQFCPNCGAQQTQNANSANAVGVDAHIDPQSAEPANSTYTAQQAEQFNPTPQAQPFNPAPQQAQPFNPQPQAQQPPQFNQAPQGQYIPPQQYPQTPPPAETENKTLATCALVFAFLMPIVGLILGIVGTVKYKTPKYKNQCIAAIPVSIVVWILGILMMSL